MGWPGMSDETRREVVPLEVDVLLVGSLDDIADAVDALGPTSGGHTASTAGFERDDHRIEASLRAWGWYATIHDRAVGLVGLYGDWVWLEDEERLMPALAPFAHSGGRVVFQDPRDARYRNPDGIRAWSFENGGVTLQSVEMEIVYHLNG